MISMGYTYAGDGSLAWTSSEVIWLVELAYAAATGQVAQSPTFAATANGIWLHRRVGLATCVAARRTRSLGHRLEILSVAAAARQIRYYPGGYPASCSPNSACSGCPLPKCRTPHRCRRSISIKPLA